MTLWDDLRSFDESGYRSDNPDVAGAVDGGSFRSGLQHYLFHGRREGRGPSELSDELAGWEDRYRESRNWPSSSLRLRVHGDENLDNFVWLGQRIAIDLVVALHALGLMDRATGPVLDFGAGCGRVARALGGFGNGPVFGTDIDAETIAWCQHYLDAERFTVNAAWPPLQHPTESFALVYAISVFTHLPQDMEDAWLSELARVARPDGVLLLTVHGTHLFDGSAATSNDGFVYSEAGGADGLPEFYRTSFHSSESIVERWSRHLDVIAHLPLAINDHQDLVVARPRR